MDGSIQNIIAKLGTKRPAIAIVDDNPELQSLYKLIIASKGYQISFVASDGAEALEKQQLANPKPDIIIMDYRLPKMNGIETTKEILKEYPDTNIIFIGADESIEKDALSAGASRFLKKPISLSDLLNNLSAAPPYNISEEPVGKIKRPRGRPEIPEEERKVKAAYSITKKVADEFADICKFNGEDSNRLVEGFLKKYTEEQKNLKRNLKLESVASHEIGQQAGAQQKTILVTDDHPRTTEVIADMLEKMGYKTLRAYSGQECIELVRQKKPDLVLLDIIMDGMDGWEVAAVMKNDPELKKTPVIMVTGKTPTIDDIYNRLHLIENYIMKPVTSYTLKEVIEQVFSSKSKQNIELIARMAIQSAINLNNTNVISQLPD